MAVPQQQRHSRAREKQAGQSRAAEDEGDEGFVPEQAAIRGQGLSSTAPAAACSPKLHRCRWRPGSPSGDDRMPCRANVGVAW
jgi:hypothetical protein